MKHVYFVRHGESEFNKAKRWTGSTDSPLTDKGCEQARKTGKHLQEKHAAFDLIISSPLERAHHTAKIIAESIGYPINKIELDAQLVERSFGKLEGNKDLLAASRYLLDESAIDRVEGAETLTDLQQRADRFWKKLQSNPNDRILVVGHGAFGRALRRSIQGIPMHKRGSSFSNAEAEQLV